MKGISHLGDNIICKDCNLTFKGQECMEQHILNKKCGNSWKCDKCLIVVKNRSKDQHRCYEIHCKGCKDYFPKDHKCYLKKLPFKNHFDQASLDPIKEDKIKESHELIKGRYYPRNYIYFDLEATVDENGIHRFNQIQAIDQNNNIVISMVTTQLKKDAYSSYMDYGIKYIKDHCENNLAVYDTSIRAYKENIDNLLNSVDSSDDIIDSFCTLLTRKYRGYTCIAHYGKAYDFIPIISWLEKYGIRPSKVTWIGNKIVFMKLPQYNIRFVDSISLIANTPLSSFAETFGLTSTKGDFPHFFNKPENYGYIGPYPDKKYYPQSRLKPSSNDRIKFEEWYKSVKKQQFYFMHQFISYCKQDVNILRQGCIHFRKIFIDLCGIDPFAYYTIAQVTMTIYKNLFMPKDTIAVHINKGRESTISNSFKMVIIIR